MLAFIERFAGEQTAGMVQFGVSIIPRENLMGVIKIPSPVVFEE
jgi:hypothetical protein